MGHTAPWPILKSGVTPSQKEVWFNSTFIQFTWMELTGKIHTLSDRSVTSTTKAKWSNQIFLPFGIGKRQCLGESLAKNTYFLFTTAVLKTFHIERIPNEPLPPLDPNPGFVIGYKGFKAVLRER